MVVELVSAVLAMAFALIVMRLSIPYVDQSWSIGEGTANPGGIEYRYVIKSLIPIGFAFCSCNRSRRRSAPFSHLRSA
jgi:TRAP-type mannitol/chloroaromatic compound transport system permease small subunit